MNAQKYRKAHCCNVHPQPPSYVVAWSCSVSWCIDLFTITRVWKYPSPCVASRLIVLFLMIGKAWHVNSGFYTFYIHCPWCFLGEREGQKDMKIDKINHTRHGAESWLCSGQGMSVRLCGSHCTLVCQLEFVFNMRSRWLNCVTDITWRSVKETGVPQLDVL